jgi:hypothetical protein
MRYIPVAAPGFVERYPSEGFTAAAVPTARSLAWNRDGATTCWCAGRAADSSEGRSSRK